MSSALSDIFLQVHTLVFAVAPATTTYGSALFPISVCIVIDHACKALVSPN